MREITRHGATAELGLISQEAYANYSFHSCLRFSLRIKDLFKVFCMVCVRQACPAAIRENWEPVSGRGEGTRSPRAGLGSRRRDPPAEGDELYLRRELLSFPSCGTRYVPAAGKKLNVSVTANYGAFPHYFFFF